MRVTMEAAKVRELGVSGESREEGCCDGARQTKQRAGKKALQHRTNARGLLVYNLANRI